MQTENLLREFGLNEKEIAVYLCLVGLGPSAVRSIAQKSGINRGTTYDILRSLKEQGLVSFNNKQAHQSFAAEPPEKIIQAIDEKKRQLGRLKIEAEKSLPALKSIFEKFGGKPLVRYYEGPAGVKQVLEDVLHTMQDASHKTYFVYSSSSVDLRKKIYKKIPDFSKRRIKLKINVKTISLGKGGALSGLDERKCLNVKGALPNATHEIIYDGKIAFISLNNSGEPVAVIVANSEIYKMQKMIFESNWERL
ncbi:MAG: hypothetical protein HYW51_02030 [Candidatus Doudnabacteria bacterium]|nr:hypothetical protein [Candidatus Doudnabacteria bacterium]